MHGCSRQQRPSRPAAYPCSARQLTARQLARHCTARPNQPPTGRLPARATTQDAFGNYVVQYVLELGQTEPSRGVMNNLAGHYAELSMQKFSSNVVEKCLKLGGLDPERHVIIREVLSSPLLPRLLQDSYGNYVVQSALAVSSGALHQELVDAIKPFLPSLRGTPHGKRILQKINGKV